MGTSWAAGILLSHFCEFESFLGWEFKILQEFSLFQNFCEILETFDFPGSIIPAQRLAVNRSLGGEKIVLYIVCFAYSLLSSLLQLLVVVVVLVFT